MIAVISKWPRFEIPAAHIRLAKSTFGNQTAWTDFHSRSFDTLTMRELTLRTLNGQFKIGQDSQSQISHARFSNYLIFLSYIEAAVVRNTSFLKVIEVQTTGSQTIQLCSKKNIYTWMRRSHVRVFSTSVWFWVRKNCLLSGSQTFFRLLPRR